MIGESMDLPTQALALGYLSLSWGFGTILGMLCHKIPCFAVRQHTLMCCATTHLAVPRYNTPATMLYVSAYKQQLHSLSSSAHLYLLQCILVAHTKAAFGPA